MKREIKFRGKNPKDGKWYYGSLVLDYDKKPMILVAGYSHTGSAFSGCLNVIPETVGQFTGLKDSNGKKIYEGDILKITQVRPKIEPPKDLGTVEVKFNPWYGWAVGTRYDRYEFTPDNPIDIIEVIGNIHDNPDLQKKGEL